MATFFIGIDVGTSGTKAVLIDSEGALISTSGGSYPMHHPRPMWVDQDPHSWWDVASAAIRDLLAKTEADAEEERRGEEEAFRRALERSLSERKVSEDELVEDAVRRSLSENDRGDGSRGEDEDPEEMVRRVMRLSLDEERRAAREEEEQIRAALEWSVLESACSD